MNKIDAYLAVIVASLLPIFVAIISFFLNKDKIHFLSVIGIIVEFLEFPHMLFVVGPP